MTYTDQEKTAIITQYRQGKPIQQLCAECGVCARTIYRWARTYCPVVPDEKRREEYCGLIREVFDEYRQVLGAEKIRTILVQRGQQISKEYVARLMKEMGLSSIPTTAKQDYMKLHEPEKKRNVLRQQFQADKPNQIWVSDVTCFKLGELYLYTCVILDLFSRRVVAHKVSRKNSTQLITSTFKAAWEQRAPDAGLIFHSDRGDQYTSHRF